MNVVYLAERATGAADMLLFVRSLALNALVLSVLPLGSTLTRRRPPRWLAGALIAIVAARTLLWPTTHLFVTHRSTHGYAEYGPWSAPAAVLVLVLLFGYLFHVAISTSERRERAALVSALFVSLVLAAASVTTTSRLAAELLTGYTTVPALAGVTALLWMRQNHAQRRLARLATRQQAVAEVAALAVDQPLDVVRAAAERAIRGDAALRTSTKPLSLACLLDDPTTQAAVADPDDREFLVSLTGVVTAAAAARRANAELARRATVDELTGLANRTAFYQLVTNTLCEGGGSSQRIAVIVCNIDRFTTINEAYGHEVGDEVLRVIAARLRDCGDTSQHVARLGGDEFGLVCLAAAGTEGIERLVEACHQVFRDSINVGA
ncbi:MAG: GGDEF domain-containing protein, partial [Frankiales bacterium]|nr:GGDEF domain-containing protein [Frankiales bacterium]